MIAVIAGGTGSIKLIRGLVSCSQDVVVISNVGDNIWLYDLYVCPDIDTIIYGLSGLLDIQRGWGIKDDTFSFLQQMQVLDQSIWFRIGDRDLATHILRTNMLHSGKSLSEITEWMAKKYGIPARIIPSSDSHIETRILTDIGEMHLQEYWVKYQSKPHVFGIKYKNIEKAHVPDGVISSIRNSDAIIVAPANPITSIGPIVNIKEIRNELVNNKKKIVAVSPIVGKEAISGPAGKYMESLNLDVSSAGVAQYYSEFIGSIVISSKDVGMANEIKKLGICVRDTDIIMKDRNDENRLAGYLLEKTSV